MKTTNILAVFSLLIFIAFQGFQAQAQSETRNVGKFTGVKMGVPGDLYITQGSPQKVVIEAPQDRLERIETEVEGGRLVIKQKDSWKSWKSWGGKNIKVYITVPSIDYLAVSGSGSIESQNTIRGEDMYLGVSGSGKMDVDVRASNLEGRISGSGNLDLKGNAEDFEVSISGSGNVDAEDLTTANCEVRISGSGNCRVEVTKSLESRVSGSGNVYYKGNPDKVNSSASGSGSLRKIG